jgi:hypothetical protein
MSCCFPLLLARLFSPSLLVVPGSSRFSVLPVLDEIGDDGRIGERRGVAEIAKVVFRDLA